MLRWRRWRKPRSTQTKLSSMLASPSREEDRQVAQVLLEILSGTIRLYQRTGNEELVQTIQELKDGYEKTLENVKMKDYTRDDAFIHRVLLLRKQLNDKIK